MRNNLTKEIRPNRRYKKNKNGWLNKGVVGGAGLLAAMAMTQGAHAQSSDPLLDLMIKKGMVTEAEAQKVKAELDASRSNNLTAAAPASKWKLSDGIKKIELFGDFRFRYEDRLVHVPGSQELELQRYRYAVRFGLRGDLNDDFYYGLRLETASNPRSPWLTFGTSSSGTPYQGPFGKSTAALNIGQVYVGWRPENWVDVTVGKMPNPFYTTPMVWDTDLNPEGLAERFKYQVGDADFFATFGQFVYQDTNPAHAGVGLVSSIPNGQDANTLFLLGWQAGLTYHLDKDMSFKAAMTLYNYTSHGHDASPNSLVPGFSDIFVGQSGPISGQNSPAGSLNDGFYFNQTGVNDLLVIDFPFEFNFKIARLNARIFGDFAENLDGTKRAEAAAAVAAAPGASAPFAVPFPVQRNESMAYQAGFAISNGEGLGTVYGSTAKKGIWEGRAYWQHVEQYALDPNLLDSDFFEGRGNLQGLYVAVAYGFTDNIIGTFHYGYASRINKNLGTGGSNQDLPQVNPIDRYQLFQIDLTYKF
jgi:hypothetical protein